jgi:hypothetical protein
MFLVWISVESSFPLFFSIFKIFLSPSCFMVFVFYWVVQIYEDGCFVLPNTIGGNSWEKRSEWYDPHRLVDLVSCFDQNNLRLGPCICLIIKLSKYADYSSFVSIMFMAMDSLMWGEHFLCPFFCYKVTY